ncbi:IST1 homolog isoform X2 [Durio zibethinus]|uniref:IST1 homolog isoform X2 n=1 Tax=Durio zibethinus TaxID=66656 RepID=A0A6P6AYP9_DURZI|nr:IST1 homolog isoform X2 [Durio zibethinus]
MGRKLDALLGRNFKTSKFRTLAKLATSRTGILKNQHQVKYSHARSDVIELLNLGHQEQALLRVEHVIKEQNMVDVFTIMESYCHLLIERVMLIQNNRECPDELKEATSSLIFASSRCAEFPELLHIRGILSSTFGKEFVARAVELRNNCCVHPKKLSTRQPSLESKLKVLKEIASEGGITLHLEAVVVEEKLDVNEKQNQSVASVSAKLDDPEHKDTAYDWPREINLNENFSESIEARKKYRDVAAAAQEAFESAAYAAAAARAAVELSRTQPQDFDPYD